MYADKSPQLGLPTQDLDEMRLIRGSEASCHAVKHDPVTRVERLRIRICKPRRGQSTYPGHTLSDLASSQV